MGRCNSAAVATARVWSGVVRGSGRCARTALQDGIGRARGGSAHFVCAVALSQRCVGPTPTRTASVGAMPQRCGSNGRAFCGCCGELNMCLTSRGSGSVHLTNTHTSSPIMLLGRLPRPPIYMHVVAHRRRPTRQRCSDNGARCASGIASGVRGYQRGVVGQYASRTSSWLPVMGLDTAAKAAHLHRRRGAVAERPGTAATTKRRCGFFLCGERNAYTWG